MTKRCPICDDLGIGITFFPRMSKGSFCVKCTRCGALVKPYTLGKITKVLRLIFGLLFGAIMGVTVVHLASVYPIMPKSIHWAEQISIVIYLYIAILIIFNAIIFISNDFKALNKS
jgi:hypothetical protein